MSTSFNVGSPYAETLAQIMYEIHEYDEMLDRINQFCSGWQDISVQPGMKRFKKEVEVTPDARAVRVTIVVLEGQPASGRAFIETW